MYRENRARILLLIFIPFILLCACTLTTNSSLVAYGPGTWARVV